MVESVLYTNRKTACNSCGKEAEGHFRVDIWKTNENYSEIILCGNCRKRLFNLLKDTVVDVPEPHGGKWFEIWDEDKKGILSCMYKNLSSDLEAGYDYSGKAIQNQLEEIHTYEADYRNQLGQFATMTDGEVSRWCYYDLKRRGAIS